MGSVSIADSAENNESVMIVDDDSAMPEKTSKGTKKATRAKNTAVEPEITAGKTGVEESMQASSFIEPEDDDFEVKIAPAAGKATKGKKRKSGEKHEIPQVSSASSAKDLSIEPPPKRRATRSLASNVQAQSMQSSAIHEQDNDLHMTDGENIFRPQAPASKKGGKGRKKRGSSTIRKASATSTASMASLRAPVPNDEEIEAALEADLDRPLTDEESDSVPQPVTSSKTRRLTRTKPTSRNATASVAPTRQMTRTISPSNVIDEPGAKLELEADTNPESEPVIKLLPPKASKSRKPSKKHGDIVIADANQAQALQTLVGLSENDTSRTANFTQSKTRQTSRQAAASKPQEPAATGAPAVDYPTVDMNGSTINSRATEDDSGHETDASVLKKDTKKRGPRKGTKKPKGGRKAAPKSRNIEDIVQPEEGAEVPTNESSADAMMVDEPKLVDAQVLDEPAPTKTTMKKTANSTRTKTAKVKEVTPKTPPPAPTTDEPWTDEVLGESTPLLPVVTRVPSPPTARAQTPVVVIEVAKASTNVPSPERTPSPMVSRQSSDAENQPPSSRPSALRPPLNMQSPSKAQTIRIPLAASTPTTSPSKRNISKLQTSMPWKAIEFEKIFLASPDADKENMVGALGGALTSPEKKLTVEEWIYQNARESDERLRSECERLVGRFEGEGLRALKSLEGIRCLE